MADDQGYGDTGFPEHKPFQGNHYQGHAALLDWPYKIHVIAKGQKKPVIYELYNLESDPMERNNLAGSEEEVFQRMQRALAAWQKSVIHSPNGGDYPKQSN